MLDSFGRAFLGSVRLRTGAPSMLGASGTAWWIHHIAGTRAYLEAAIAGDQDRAVKAVLGLWDGILEWDRIAGKAAGVLMAEHTALAKLLIDCLALRQGGSCADTAAAALGRNVEAQGLLFPKDPQGFAALFGRHVEVTGGYIAAYAEGRREEFVDLYDQALANGGELDSFTSRNFGVRS